MLTIKKGNGNNTLKKRSGSIVKYSRLSFKTGCLIAITGCLLITGYGQVAYAQASNVELQAALSTWNLHQAIHIQQQDMHSLAEMNDWDRMGADSINYGTRIHESAKWSGLPQQVISDQVRLQMLQRGNNVNSYEVFEMLNQSNRHESAVYPDMDLRSNLFVYVDMSIANASRLAGSFTPAKGQSVNPDSAAKANTVTANSKVVFTDDLLAPEQTRVLKEVKVTATGYTAGIESTGKKPGHPEYGITYSGVKVRRDYVSTIAADLKEFPIGSILYVPGYGYGIVADIGSAIKGKKLDLYFDTTKQVYSQWGKKVVDVQVIKKGSGKVTEEFLQELNEAVMKHHKIPETML